MRRLVVAVVITAAADSTLRNSMLTVQCSVLHLTEYTVLQLKPIDAILNENRLQMNGFVAREAKCLPKSFIEETVPKNFQQAKETIQSRRKDCFFRVFYYFSLTNPTK
jgi:hypothetical protein